MLIFCFVIITYSIILTINLDFRFTEIPKEYAPACDKYYGYNQWKTIGMDWITHDPDFVRQNPHLFYLLEDKNGQIHDYGCVSK